VVDLKVRPEGKTLWRKPTPTFSGGGGDGSVGEGGGGGGCNRVWVVCDGDEERVRRGGDGRAVLVNVKKRA
jgi:hypothetical protein